jgi:hypothetical protein
MGKRPTYKYLNKKKKILPAERLPQEGTWLPISVVAHLTGFSSQKIRLDYLQNKVEGIKFPVGPILINITSLKEYSDHAKGEERRGI